jgi:4-hydroxy-tetrahydrodipicolinate synthase
MLKALDGIGGSLVALPTPFQDRSIDEAALIALVERQITRGTAALVACGSTGEASSLTQQEAAEVVRIVVRSAAGRVPVIAGCTAACTERSIALAVDANRAGADALLCAPPPYSKPTQDGIAAHIRAVAQAAKLPIVVYDVPSRTGVAIADVTVARLFEDGLIVGIKDATADLSRPPRLRVLCGDALLQYSGDDATAAAHRAMGGAGCISVTANVAPALCAKLHLAWDEGDLAMFARVRDLLDPLHAALFAESNPIPLKAALAELGLCSHTVRLPLTQAEPATVARLRDVMAVVVEVKQPMERTPHVAQAG